jgi:hypothetical protein
VFCLELEITNNGDSIMMKVRICFNGFMAVLSMMILITACSTGITSPTPTNTMLPPPTSTLPLPTFTIAPYPGLTPSPQNTDVPNHYDQNDNFGDGFIALIPIKDTTNLSREEIMTRLVSLWLDHYKTKSMAPLATIKDYKDVSVNKLIEDNHNYDNFFDTVASVRFSIIPSGIPNDWASLPGEPINPKDPWWHLFTTFGFFKDGDYYRLREMPGWGT